ncbi:structure-specific endonuclease subunit SLX4 [Lampris incognitus]|uniref:structure-specific endonuclease subunit SLX4 n=1 Tax=Lampris incognitus TaxID=2546036 RepID=UPI0024B59F12|nr:structure-specific endonuclease subunit SLX4 [Lampris incognitus]
MDDSDQDFADLCSKLRKRVRKTTGDTGLRSKRNPPSSAQPAAAEPSKRRPEGRDAVRGSKRAALRSEAPPARSDAEDADAAGAKQLHHGQPSVGRGDVPGSGDAEPPASADPGASEPVDRVAYKSLGAKEKVLHRMQQFKRVNPQRLVHSGSSKPTETEGDAVTPAQRSQDVPVPTTCVLRPEFSDGDKALAVKLQQDLDRETAEAQAVTLEDRGLFFCQLCQRDLSHMTLGGRTQHLNRCLDEREEKAPAPPPPSGVPDCPICGKRFKSQKSRSAHLKRCSSDLGVTPAVLLQALQRQAAEAQNGSAANQLPQVGGSKRKGPPGPDPPDRKKSRKKGEPVDEDTMVALALSSSLLEQETGREKERQRGCELGREVKSETAVPHTAMMPQLIWRHNAGKGRGKRKKDAVPRPPPLLLIQDAETAQKRIQERVSALLLRTRTPSPPTPTRCSSNLPAWSGAAVLWQKSALRDDGPSSLLEFYTLELREFIAPPESAKVRCLFSTMEGTPLSAAKNAILPSSSQMASSSTPSTPGAGSLLGGSQALNDLMELADEGMTFTQLGYAGPGPPKDKESRLGQDQDFQLSGFVLEEPEVPVDLRLSGFIPEAEHTQSPPSRSNGQQGTDTRGGDHKSVAVFWKNNYLQDIDQVALSRLASDLSSMVNNPQLSDVQLQVDSGEVYFAHSFMLYARCPLLSQMVHVSGFGVQEDDMHAANRVLLAEVAGEAVHTLLQYLYTGRCPVSAPLLPDVLELASRFNLEELQQLCHVRMGQTESQEEKTGQRELSEEDDFCQKQQSGPEEDQRDQAFVELLRSMWDEEEDEKNDGREMERGGDGGTGLQFDNPVSGDEGSCEEQVNEEEMEEIYEFAATQKQGKKRDSIEEEEELWRTETEEEHSFTKPDVREPKTLTDSEGQSVQPSLDRSCSHLFSDSPGIYEEEASSSLQPSLPTNTQSNESQQKNSTSKPLSTTVKEEIAPDTCPQPLAIEVIDLSISPPLSTSSLPLPGVSPGSRSDREKDEDEEMGRDNVKWNMAEDFPSGSLHPRVDRLTPYQETQRLCSLTVPFSPTSPNNSKEPELVVLSDSSEEMEVGLAAQNSPCPSPRSPYSSQTCKNYTLVKTRSNSEPTKPSPESKESSVLESSPSGPSATPVQGPTGSSPDSLDHIQMDYSPEVSWLIPATPVQCGRRTSSSSTQTYSSMCRVQLFPKASCLSSSSPYSAHPSVPLQDKLQTSSCPAKISTQIIQTDSMVPREEVNRSIPHSSGLDLKQPMKRNHNSGKCSQPAVVSGDSSPVFAVPPSRTQPSRPSSVIQLHPLNPQQDITIKGTPLHCHLQPSSSTPLHTDLHRSKPPVLSTASPLLSDTNSKGSLGQGRLSQSPQKRPVCLSLTDLPNSPSLSPLRGPLYLHGSSGSCRQNGHSPENDFRENMVTGLTDHDGAKAREMRGEYEKRVEEEKVSTVGKGGQEAEEEIEEADSFEASFRQSFMAMDEPPMAFNDSWGLDTGGDKEGDQGLCFSLRLEDSGGAIPQEHSRGEETASSSPHAVSSEQPAPSYVDAIYPFKTHNCERTNASLAAQKCSAHPSSPLLPTAKTDSYAGPHFTPSPLDPNLQTAPEVGASLLDSKLWESWKEEEEEEEEEALPLSQRVNLAVKLKTPEPARRKQHGPLVPITPMACYSDMDTPELKNKLNRFGVRPLPKRQMILKLKEIHQYTHQLVSSDSEEEVRSQGRPMEAKPLPATATTAPSARSVSCAKEVKFKQPRAPPVISPVKHNSEEDEEPLSASQGSNTSSTATSEDSERSYPELCHSSSSDSDSDGGMTASQAASRRQDTLKAVRSFILSHPELYSEVLQYKPLVLTQLQAQLKAVGIRLGTAKLLDYLDSQCITVTTAKPGHPARSRRRRKGRGPSKGKPPHEGAGKGKKRGAVAAPD